MYKLLHIFLTCKHVLNIQANNLLAFCPVYIVLQECLQQENANTPTKTYSFVIIIITITIFRNAVLRLPWFSILGSLRCHEGHGDENVKKAIIIGLKEKQQLCTCSSLFGPVISLPSLHDYDIKLRLILRFIDKGEQTTTNCSVLVIFLKDSPPGEFNINSSRFRFVILAW